MSSAYELESFTDSLLLSVAGWIVIFKLKLRHFSAAYFRNDLQGIRAIAITSVMLFHFYPYIFPNGHVGVDQFFVLSGFLMTAMCEREKHFGIKQMTWFYYRRVKRIVPSYLLAILLSLICSKLLLPDYLLPPNLTSARAALKFTTNIEATDSIKEYNVMLTRAADLFTHTWSIAVEMQFYVLFPCIFLAFRRLPDWIAIIWVVVLGSISLLCHIKLTPPEAFSYVHARMLLIYVLGIFIHLLSKNSVNAGDGTPKKCTNTIFYGLCLAGVIGTNLLVFISVEGLIHRTIAVSLTAGLILLNSRQNVNFLTSKYIVYIGHISYSLYLVHWPIYIVFKQNFVETAMGMSRSIHV
ncbi:acyltransferase, partial [Ancylostoma caninum]